MILVIHIDVRLRNHTKKMLESGLSLEAYSFIRRQRNPVVEGIKELGHCGRYCAAFNSFRRRIRLNRRTEAAEGVEEPNKLYLQFKGARSIPRLLYVEERMCARAHRVDDAIVVVRWQN